MDTEVLVDDQIDDGQLLVEQLIKDNFNVSVAFWVKTNEDAAWQLYLAFPEGASDKSTEAYRKVYYSLDSISPVSISNSDISIINDNNPIAQAAIEQRDRLPARIPSKYFGKRLGPLAIKEAYIYPKLEPPVRQSFTVSYVRHGEADEWTATVRMNEFNRGHQAKGVISYSTTFGLTPESEAPRFALIYVMVEVGPGIDENVILNTPVIMIQLAEQARTLADAEFRRKHPQATILHEPSILRGIGSP
jgi:hypothetical protein